MSPPTINFSFSGRLVRDVLRLAFPVFEVPRVGAKIPTHEELEERPLDEGIRQAFSQIVEVLFIAFVFVGALKKAEAVIIRRDFHSFFIAGCKNKITVIVFFKCTNILHSMLHVVSRYKIFEFNSMFGNVLDLISHYQDLVNQTVIKFF